MHSRNTQPKNPNHRGGEPSWFAILAFSLLLHCMGLLCVHVLFPDLLQSELEDDGQAVTIHIELPEPTPPPPPPAPKLVGQIVDIAPTPDTKRPEEAKFLAEDDQVADTETRTERFRVNPEVLHHEYSEEDKLEFEDLTNLDAVEPSTGAQVGNDRFNPDEDGSLAALPSPFQVTNKDGLQKPVPASHRQSVFTGAPNNDLLDVPVANRLALNTHKIQFAGYLNRIRRLVNFYWNQNLQNLPASAQARLDRPSYETLVNVILDDAGALESIEVTRTSGSRFLDAAVVRAFRIAGPFPNPPSQLIESDGRVYLPDFDFNVRMGQARAQYQGVDPRSGVRFPGILKGHP
jgi:TonB family protein